MKQYCITNGKLILKDQIIESNLFIDGNKIVEISDRKPIEEEIIDVKGNYVSPGFIEMHSHGRGGHDCMEATKESLKVICDETLKTGVTGYLATTMTMSIEDTAKAIQNIKDHQNDLDTLRILGVHMEGPFFSKAKCGAQPEEYMIKPTIEHFKALTNDNEDIIRKISVASELEGMDTLIPYLVEKGIVVSLGHTSATYDQARKGIELGATSGTHTFNAMTSFMHRDPGVVGAIMESDDVYAELILDGLHVSLPAARVLIKAKGVDKITLITDSLEAAGLPEGIYSVANQPIEVKNGACYLKDTTTLAGSITSMNQELYNLIHYFHIDLIDAIKMVSTNAANELHEEKLGEIKVGNIADLTVFNDTIDVQMVIVDGNIKYQL